MSRRLSGLWGHPEFLKLWTGQTISLFGSLIGRIALPMMVVLVLDATPMQVSLLRAVEVAPGLVAGLFAGVWVDRLRRRPIMIVADMGRAVLMGLIPLLFLLGSLTMGYVYAIAFFISILTIFFDVAYQSYMPTLVQSAHLVEANSKLEATASIAEITGFGLSGFLVQILTAPITILIDAISFVASAIFLLRIRTPEAAPPLPETREGMWSEIKAGMQVLFSHPVLRALVAADGLSNLFGNIIGTVIMLFVLKELQVSPSLAGVIFGFGGVSAFFGALLAAPVVRRFGLGRSLIVAAFMSGASVAFLAGATGPMPIIIAMLIAQQLFGDGAMMVFAINNTSLRQAITPERFLGRVNATLRVSDWTFMLVGTLVGGVLGEAIGLRGALVVACLGKLLAVVWLWFSPVREIQHHPDSAAAEA
ncbi:MAG: transporter [Symbiobacteriaceae bacterium]|jgi:MFS family permease|nr:transporter [Symbiobacteriaceae bacterium]